MDKNNYFQFPPEEPWKTEKLKHYNDINVIPKLIKLIEKQSTKIDTKLIEALLGYIIISILEIAKTNLISEFVITTQNQPIIDAITLLTSPSYDDTLFSKFQKFIQIEEIKYGIFKLKILKYFKYNLTKKEKDLIITILTHIKTYIKLNKFSSEIKSILNTESLQDLPLNIHKELFLMTLYYESTKGIENYTKFLSKNYPKNPSRELKNTHFDYIIIIKQLSKEGYIKLTKDNGKLIFKLTKKGKEKAKTLFEKYELTKLFDKFKIKLLTTIAILKS